MVFPGAVMIQTQSQMVRGRVVVRQQQHGGVARQTLVVSAKYRGHGTDLSKVDQFERHENDTGSPEAQVARLTARVEQLTAHLKIHSKDYSTRRGLMRILSKRKQMLIYLRDNDKATYERCLQGLGIRQLKSEI